ncbi:type IIL restriction-modification enzyme MmeI [Halorussus aquaticus]|uniref:type IIL restriction-modification enzyme MmeI n=1 Tax=Halorussus aquaticus TaxID=2953748 RepID=UPI0020B6D561|nr:type IIL restriction-modification enzyme MmeI [Halorussus aquaticus]
MQVILDRMIFLYFIQEKRLLDRNPNYLHEQPNEVVDEGGDHYEEFYEPLFFEYLAEDKQNPDFGSLPYLNGGLFARNPVEEEFEDAKLGGPAEETNELFDDILDFLSDWNWNVDERLDIVDPKNLSPAILGHIFEQTVNQKEMGAYYTPEEITGFMARRTIHPYLLDQLNETVDADYDEIDNVFGFPCPKQILHRSCCRWRNHNSASSNGKGPDQPCGDSLPRYSEGSAHSRSCRRKWRLPARRTGGADGPIHAMH